MESTLFKKDDRLKTVYVVADLVQARVIRNHLWDHDVPCELDGDQQARYTGGLDIGVLVRETDADEARIVLRYHQQDVV